MRIYAAGAAGTDPPLQIKSGPDIAAIGYDFEGLENGNFLAGTQAELPEGCFDMEVYWNSAVAGAEPELIGTGTICITEEGQVLTTDPDADDDIFL